MKNKNFLPLFAMLALAVTAMALGSCAFMRRQADLAAIRNAAPFTVDMRSQSVQAGSTQAQFDNPVPFMRLRTADITVLYYPIEDAVCLRYRIDTYTFNQFWDRQGRQVFIRAVERYNEDFEARELRPSRTDRTRRIYGTVRGFLVWQSMSFTLQARANMDVDMGYYFRENSPFFAVTQGEAFMTNYNDPQLSKMVSGDRILLLTRAQIAELAAMFDQDFLRGLTPGIQPASPRVTPDVSPDEY